MSNRKYHAGMYVVWCPEGFTHEPTKIIYMIDDTHGVSEAGGYMDLEDSRYRPATKEEMDELKNKKLSFGQEVDKIFSGLRADIGKLEDIFRSKK